MQGQLKDILVHLHPKMIGDWRRQEEGFWKLKKITLCSAHIAKWPDQDTEVKKWITDCGNYRICVSVRMTFFGTRRWMVTHSIADFAEIASWCFWFMKRHGQSMPAWTRLAQKMPDKCNVKILQFDKFMITANKKLCYKRVQTGNVAEPHLAFCIPSKIRY